MGKYIYSVSVKEIISVKGITVEADNEISIISEGEPLYWGDSITIIKPVEINRFLFKGKLSLDKTNESPFFRLRNSLRDKIENKIRITGSENGLTLALVTGCRDDLLRDDVVKFRRSGCTHLLALSGMHLGIISLLFYFLIKPAAGIKTAVVSVNLINLFYLAVAGLSPSLIRACILSAVLSYGKLKNIKIPVQRALLLTFLINVMIAPDTVRSLSFQYSYLALSGIIFFSKPFYRILIRCFPPVIAAPLSCSLGAQLFTAPLSAHVFGEIFLSGIIASVLLTPLIILLMWSSIISLFAVFSGVFSFCSIVFTSFNSLVSGIILETVSFFFSVPFCSV